MPGSSKAGGTGIPTCSSQTGKRPQSSTKTNLIAASAKTVKKKT